MLKDDASLGPLIKSFQTMPQLPNVKMVLKVTQKTVQGLAVVMVV
jgi:hypothetical protein